MEKQLFCPNTTSGQAKYSAPVPFIGLYIAAASFVCFSLIFSDVIHGIRRRKPWFPCHFFSLNSVTLTLLSIAAKLPVDLTTEMPSAQDQLSKLTGTAFVCVCMGFMLPSLGSNKDSECFTNMAALTIFVVTVIVNICLQMSTGLISSFVPEHIIMMYCMLMIVSSMWISSRVIIPYKAAHMNRKMDLLTKGNGIMFQRLKLCYLHSNGANPQFALCRVRLSLVTSFVCLTCFVIVLQATFRSSFSHVFWDSNGLSDYRWSMRIIIMTQILTIVLASLTLACRFAAVIHLDHDDLPLPLEIALPYLNVTAEDYAILTIEFLMFVVVAIPALAGFVVDYFVRYCARVTGLHTIRMGLPHSAREETELQSLLSENGVKLEEWTIAKCKEDMKRWMSFSKKTTSVRHVSEILSRTRPSQQSYEFKGKGNDVSCFNLVNHTIVASILTPPNTLLTQSLSEVFDLICFVERTMNFSRSFTKTGSKLAKSTWLRKDAIRKMIMNKPQLDIDQALKNLIFGPWVSNELDSNGREPNRIDELDSNGREPNRIDELYSSIEQRFIDILHIFLSQLPCAIFKHISECPVEEYEDNARLALKFLCQVQSLEGKVEWSFPNGSNFTGIISSQVPDGSNISTSMIRSSQDHMVCNVSCDEIIQVE